VGRTRRELAHLNGLYVEHRLLRVQPKRHRDLLRRDRRDQSALLPVEATQPRLTLGDLQLYEEMAALWERLRTYQARKDAVFIEGPPSAEMLCNARVVRRDRCRRLGRLGGIVASRQLLSLNLDHRRIKTECGDHPLSRRKHVNRHAGLQVEPH
jgi:hypothetical protein